MRRKKGRKNAITRGPKRMKKKEATNFTGEQLLYKGHSDERECSQRDMEGNVS